MDTPPTPSARAPYTLASTVAFVIRSVREFDRPLLALAALNALSSAVNQFVPVFMPKYVIDQLTGHGTPTGVLATVAVFSGMLLLSQTAQTSSGNSLSNRFITVRLRLLARSGQKFMATDFQHLEDPAVLDLSKRGDRACQDNADGVEGVMHRLLSLLAEAIVVAGSVAVIATLQPLLLVAIGALLAANFLASTRARTRDKQANDALAKVRRKLGYLADVMSDFAYGKDLRLFSMKGFLLARYRSDQRQLLTGEVEIQRIWLRAKGLFALTGLAQEVLMYAWLCWRVVHGGMSIGDFVMYIAAIGTFAHGLNGILDDIAHIRQQHAVICDFRSFLDYPDRPDGSAAPPEGAEALGLGFTFEHVSFRYPGREEYALRDISLQIAPGERLAVVGLNGAGKSTFVKLLTRLYEPEAGRILLGGVDTGTYKRQAYWRLFSIVFQDIRLFAFTVAENVAMREYALTDPDRVRASLERAGLGPKIAALPAGSDTPVLRVLDETGTEFSGGETQKLALARALYKDSPVVILDEPTAALDALAEEQLYHDFDALIGQRTAIYISHRLASTRFCDRVAVFEGGRLIEVGSHQQLRTAGGRYAQLFELQAKNYRQEVDFA